MKTRAPAITRGWLARVALAWLVLAAPTTRAFAAPDPSSLSAARKVVVGGPLAGAPVAAALASGFGMSGADLGLGDRHLRLTGSLAVESAPLPWLGLGLRLDGRYDHHRFEAAPSDDGWVGEPRLFARLVRSVSDGLDAGLHLSVLLPGSAAPSIEPAATTPELLAALTYRAGGAAVTANLGYRLDRTGRTVSADQLAPGDRLALGASDFDAALVRAAADFPMGALLVFGEWSWDVLVGSGAPAPAKSPMTLGAGARAALSPTIGLELLTRARVLGPASGKAGDALVPVAPRFEVMAGLLVAFGDAAKTGSAPRDIPDAEPATPPPADLEVTLAGGPAEGAPIRVEARTAQGTFVLDRRADGRFIARGLPPGPAEIVASTDGFDPVSATVRFEPGRSVVLPLTLQRRLPVGQIRGVIRSFRGAGLPATVHIRADGGTDGPWEAVAEDGRFEVEVPPGTYVVVIEASGYRPQTRQVAVEENGVTVLNADLRALR